MKYRSKFAIASSILRESQNVSMTKNRLMYHTYLSFAQINEYLTFLLANNLIMRNEATHTYAPTERGIRFLQVSAEMDKLLSLDVPDYGPSLEVKRREDDLSF
jgi:predicted transcriptional regulator